MGEEIIGADKEAVIVCYHREGGYASYRKVQGGLAPPSLLISPECETKAADCSKRTKRSQRLHEAAAHQQSSCHTTGIRAATWVHSALPDRRSCSAQTPPAEVLVSLVVGVLFCPSHPQLIRVKR